MVGLLFLLVISTVSGCFFALLALIPTFRQWARQRLSKQFRRLLIGIASLFSFVMSPFLIVLAVFTVGGCFFALPAFIPSWRRRAHQSPAFRIGLMASLSLIAFGVFFLSSTYAGAVFTKIFTICGDIDCMTATYVFSDDDRRDALLTRELWIQNMSPPFLNLDEHCFTGDITVCELTQSIRQYSSTDANVGYLMSLFLVLVPAGSCAFYVYWITRSNRKQKLIWR